MKLFLSAAVVLALAVPLPATPARADLPLPYSLREGSDLETGCFGPCLCPILVREPMKGSFALTFEGEDPPMRRYRVSDVSWVVPGEGGGVPITGSGSYLVGGGSEPQQRMVLDLSVGGRAQHFDSGLVPGGAAFPEIAIEVAMHRFYCWDSVLSVRAAPAATAEADAGPGDAGLRPGLRGALPNPFAGGTAVAFTLERAVVVDLSAFDIRGRQVRALVSRQALEAGPHSVAWDGRDDAGVELGPGVYHLRLRAGDLEETAVVVKTR